MANLTVYGIPVSTYVRAVRLLLAEANIDHHVKEIDIFSGENKTDEYLAKHPFGKIPTVEIDGTEIYETGAITHYINQKMANGKYSPSDILMQARMYQIMSIVDSYLYAPAIGKIVIQHLTASDQGNSPDQQVIKGAIAPTKKALEAIEDLFVGSPYLLGSLLTIADFYLIPIFVYLSETPEFEAVTASTPKLLTWWNETQNLASVKQVCA